jgi:quercetin dioxygenase-like cupin family protein
LLKVKGQTMPTMTQQAFEAALKAENFPEIVNISKEIGYQMHEHVHAFDAYALILQGDITLTVNSVATTYQVGETFKLAANTMHEESAIPNGVNYLVGRRRV